MLKFILFSILRENYTVILWNIGEDILQRIIPHAWHGSFNPYIYQLKQHFNWGNFSWLNFQLQGKQRRNTKVKNDHRSTFSDLSNWKDEAWKSLASMGGAPHGRYELNILTSLQLCGFIAQFVEHCTGIAKVTGLNPVEALIFFRLLPSNTSQRRNWLVCAAFTWWIINEKL